MSGKLLGVEAGESRIVLPRWLWGGIGAVSTAILAGGIAWASWVSSKLMDLEKRAIDRTTVEQMIASNSPYSRDAGLIASHLLALDKSIDKHDTDVRRLSDSCARMEAKMDLMLNRKQ